MNNQLLKAVKLPYNTVRGSYESRQRKASNYTREIVNGILAQFGDEGMSCYRLNSTMKKFLPEDFPFSVRKARKGAFHSYLTTHLNENGQVYQYSLSSVLFSNNKKMNKVYLPIIAHEIRHLADCLFHPKIVARKQYLRQNMSDPYKYENFYFNNLYKEEKLSKNNTKYDVLKRIGNELLLFMDEFSPQESINMLQGMRYSLLLEKNAYTQENKIIEFMDKKNIPVSKFLKKNQAKGLMLDEKIELLKRMTAKLIDSERRKNACNIAKKKAKTNVLKEVGGKKEDPSAQIIYFGFPPKNVQNGHTWFERFSTSLKSAFTNLMGNGFSHGKNTTKN